ncbi:histidine kinase [Bernardetia sp. ABR2-2B]|uniref:sensor histidine kinase n=1 Tax=Bernardetia sp. ABR2-2B TaxID=3127472 RepID=UPI0030CC7820
MIKFNNLIDWLTEKRLWRHILFWLAAFLIAPLTSSEDVSELGEAFVFRLVGMPIKILATYFLVYYQIPKLLIPKKYILFVSSIFMSVFVFCVLYRIMNVHIAEQIIYPNTEKESIVEIIIQVETTVFWYVGKVYLFSFVFLFFKMFRDSTTEKRKIQQLEKQKTIAELNFLKAQIHPHFLFNTLNNLYMLTLTGSKKAPDVVARLSDMLDYILYQCKADRVSIEKEVILIENYIELEKLRYGDRILIELNTSIDDFQTPVPPLLLISLVENAFKHGASGVIENAIIEISIKTEKGRLFFEIFNTKYDTQQEDKEGYKEGIGIKNITQQLDLLYPNAYEWKVKDEKTSYRVKLSI